MVPATARILQTVQYKPTPGGGSSSSDRRRLKRLATKMYLRRTERYARTPIAYSTTRSQSAGFRSSRSCLGFVLSRSHYRGPITLSLEALFHSGPRSNIPHCVCPFSRPRAFPRVFPFSCLLRHAFFSSFSLPPASFLLFCAYPIPFFFSRSRSVAEKVAGVNGLTLSRARLTLNPRQFPLGRFDYPIPSGFRFILTLNV